jgi:hypothetical protein
MTRGAGVPSRGVLVPGPKIYRAWPGGRGTGEWIGGRRSLAVSTGQGQARSTWASLVGGDPDSPPRTARMPQAESQARTLAPTFHLETIG